MLKIYSFDLYNFFCIISITYLKERAKARRARERAKQKALLRKQQQMKEIVDPDESVEDKNPIQSENDDVHAPRPTSLDVNCIKSSPSRSKQR